MICKLNFGMMSKCEIVSEINFRIDFEIILLKLFPKLFIGTISEPEDRFENDSIKCNRRRRIQSDFGGKTFSLVFLSFTCVTFS